MFKKYLIAVSVLASGTAMADTNCEGKIDYVGISRNGTVVVKSPGGLPALTFAEPKQWVTM